MTGHPTDEALLRALESEADASTRAHVAVCAACAARIREAEEGLLLAGEAHDVPEPSPLYWESFRRQVDERIAAEPTSPSAWRRLFGFGWLVPAAAAVALLLALIPWSDVHAPAPDSARILPAWEALPAAADDAGLAVLEGLALGGSDLEDAAGCRGVADCLLSLSEEESRAVVLELRTALEVRS